MRIKPTEVYFVEMGTNCPFNETKGRITYKDSTFPGGEVFVRLETPVKKGSHVLICASVMTSDDLMKVIMLTDALRRAGADLVSLYMPYVPYARQDRVCNPGEALSIRVFCDMINAQNYYEVGIFDPHSDVTGACLNNVTIMNNHLFVLTALTGNEQWDHAIPVGKFALVSPDAGALKKVSTLAKFLHDNGAHVLDPVVQADKLRDMSTAKITSTVVHGDDLDGTNCVIVDDICDGGRTFIELAKALKAKGAGKIALIVSHGIFSAGLDPLLEHIDYIVWSDSVRYGMINQTVKDDTNVNCLQVCNTRFTKLNLTEAE